MTKNVSIHEILSKLASKIVGMPRTTRCKAKYSKKRWVVLVLCLMAAIIMVIVPLLGLFQKISMSMGTNLAEIVETFLGVIFGGIIILGIIFGILIDLAIRSNKYIFDESQHTSLAEHTIQMWGYEIDGQSPFLLKNTSECDKVIEKVFKIPEKATRPGRKPQFSVKDWAEVALVWEQRDPTFDLFSLEDVISQKLGRAADGGPIISAKTYRSTWRLRAIRYVNENGLAKKQIPEGEGQQ